MKTPETDAIVKISKLSDIFDLMGTNSKSNIDVIVKHACDLLEGVCCLYNRLDNSKESLIAWAHHNLPPDFNREDSPDGHICYEATIKGGDKPIIIGNLDNTIYQESDSNVTKYDLKSYLGFPVNLAGETVGALCIVDTKQRTFTDTDIHIISTLAKAVAIEEERKRAESEIQKLQKLKSVGTLAGGIAHDFNNILMGVFGNIEMAKRTMSEDHPAFAFLEKAELSMERATKLTTQLLTFAKGGVPVKENLQLDHLIREVVSFDLTGSKVQAEFADMSDLWLVDVDKGQFQQVFSNLTINAIQAMPDGGRLSVNASNTIITELQAIPLAPGRYVQITFEDNGCGIDGNIIDRIFEPYFTTSQTGNGLGLATIHSIVAKHDGYIDVESKPGKGTLFTIYLPTSPAQEPPNTLKTEPKGAIYSHPGSVLVMDDDEANRNIAHTLLTEYGYLAKTARDGEQAIEIYKEAMSEGKPFDAIILDLTIPGGMGGKEVIQQILEIDPRAKAIVSSGYSDDPVMANYSDYGFKGVAAKPYTMSKLQHILSQVMEKD